MEVAAMPDGLRLVKAPNANRAKSKTPPLYVRGTFLGVTVFRSTKTADRGLARRELKRIEDEIKAGRYQKSNGPTFAAALVAYLKDGHSKRFYKPILEHFGETPLAHIDQDAIAEAAEALHPNGKPATRNRQVYTPVNAVLKHAGVTIGLRRPKGAQGEKRTQWLRDEAEAGRLFAEAAKVDAELSTLLMFLVYTGMRLGEALAIDGGDLDLESRVIYLPKTKNGQARAVHLTPYLVAALANHPRGVEKGTRLFKFYKGQRLYQKLAKATKAAGVPWFTFHHACHTYATWMRRHAGLDERGLVGTGRWTDQKSVSRYAHVVTTEEARKADLLPVPGLKPVERDVG
jgi:integrase